MTAENLAAAKKPAINYQMLNQHADAYPVEMGIAEIIHEGFRRIIENGDISDFIKAANIVIVHNCGTNIDITGNLGDIHVTEMKGAYINNLERLKVVLGENFKTLVIDEEIATNGLIDIACDADDPLSPEVRGCITIKKIFNVHWRVKSWSTR